MCIGANIKVWIVMELQLKTSPATRECFFKKDLFAVGSTLIEQIQVALCLLMVF